MEINSGVLPYILLGLKEEEIIVLLNNRLAVCAMPSYIWFMNILKNSKFYVDYLVGCQVFEPTHSRVFNIPPFHLCISKFMLLSVNIVVNGS